MIQIRPVSDLRNKFPDIERLVNEGEPVYLTKNGYLIISKYPANPSFEVNATIF